MNRLICDFHIHSKFSMATSKNLTPPWLDFWARAKGIQVVGSGDFTHPGWLAQMQEQLQETEAGLFTLNPDLKIKENWVKNSDTRFMLTAEISTIYKKNGKTRKVHSILWAPSFEVAQKVQNELIKRNFNIKSDGRPIIGFDAKNLLELCLNISPDIVFIPAHIWTPWFSVLGANSGFDSVQECFEDLTDYIFAVESGLSSDLPMNRLISSLDSFAIVSNSDAHSPEKLGRNANIFNCDMSYFELKKALENKKSTEFIGTIDMFPQEGKYHYTGHRKCNVSLNPLEVLKAKGICPTCNKPLTPGVMDRVFELADKTSFENSEKKQITEYIIPLSELLSELYGVGPNSKKIIQEYQTLISNFNSELDLLCTVPIQEILLKSSPMLAQGIDRMRNGCTSVSEGFDGEYGKITVWNSAEIEQFRLNTLFEPTKINSVKSERFNFNLEEFYSISSEIKKTKTNNSAQQLKLF